MTPDCPKCSWQMGNHYGGYPKGYRCLRIDCQHQIEISCGNCNNLKICDSMNQHLVKHHNVHIEDCWKGEIK